MTGTPSRLRGDTNVRNHLTVRLTEIERRLEEIVVQLDELGVLVEETVRHVSEVVDEPR